jgi:hypothetical protein
MENKAHNYRYIEWKTPDEMHFSSLQWKSELNFIKDEHRFFEDMLKEYTLPIIESQLFSRVKELIEQLDLSRKDLKLLEKRVADHIKKLRELLENTNEQREGHVYRQEHKEILNDVTHYSRQYKRLKRDIFQTVGRALKQQKQKRLLA